jgi:hypothetical protein
MFAACLTGHSSALGIGGEVYSTEAVLARLRMDATWPIGVGQRANTHGWVFDVADEIRYLSKTSDDVDERLAKLAGEPHPLHVRVRAAVALLARRSDRGVDAVAPWATSEQLAERMACWVTLQRSPDHKLVEKRLSPSQILEAYRGETNVDVREEMELFFYRHKATYAVNDLCKTIEAPQYRGSMALPALGHIGDRRAVRSIIKCNADPGSIINALGKLGGEEAVDSLIAHRNLKGVGRAFGDAKDPRAIPVLKRSIESLSTQVRTRRESRRKPTDELDWLEDEEMESRVALLLLSSEKPAEAIMDIIESGEIDAHLRYIAMYGLRGLTLEPVRQRLLALYRNERSSVVGRECIALLRDQPGNDVTEAFVAHLMAVYSPESPRAVTLWGTSDRGPLIESLHDATHARIGNRLFDVVSKCEGFPSR